MTNDLWAIVVALPHEAQAILPKMSMRARIRGHGFKIWEGELAQRKVLLLQSGLGVESAARAGAFLFEHFPLSHVLATGYCGALQEGLKNSEAILADSLGSEGVEPISLALEPNLHLALQKSLAACSISCHQGRLWTSRKAVLKIEDKKSLGKTAGAIAVDMETFPLFQASLKAPQKIAFLSLRFVLDAVDDELAPTEGFVDPSGHVVPLHLIKQVLKRPKLIVELQGLGHKATLARSALASWIECFFKNLPEKH